MLFLVADLEVHGAGEITLGELKANLGPFHQTYMFYSPHLQWAVHIGSVQNDIYEERLVETK